MISVVIATHESERLLVPTLAALVPGALAGVVREVIVADAGSRDDTAKVADVAGCRFMVTPGSHGCAACCGGGGRAQQLAPVPAAGQRAGHRLDRRGRSLCARMRTLGRHGEHGGGVSQAAGTQRIEPRQSVVANCDRAWGAAKAQPGIADRQIALRRARRPRRRQRQSGNRFAPPARPETHCSAQLRDDAGGLISASPCPSASW